jgi:hypothetical protein
MAPTAAAINGAVPTVATIPFGANEMSLSARMLVSYAAAIADGHAPDQIPGWLHCCRVLAAHIIGEGV